MSHFEAFAIVIVLATAFGYVNQRFIGLPHVVGLTIASAVASAGVVSIDVLLPGRPLAAPVKDVVNVLDFPAVLLNGILSFVLFAGALPLDIRELAKRRYTIGGLATFGVIVSTLVVGFGFREITQLLGNPLPLVWCLLFGALISPTDPISVLAILRSQNVSPVFEAEISGESLFNDGVGIVLVVILTAAAAGNAQFSWLDGAEMFAIECFGGAAYGLAIGWLAYRVLKTLDDHRLEILVTLALVMGGYALAQRLAVSGPIAMAVAGLFIGNRGARHAMSENTRQQVITFWAVIDDVLNSILFVMIGLEVVAISLGDGHYLYGLAAIPIVLVARACGVGVPLAVLRLFRPIAAGEFAVLVWGGLRGAIPIALALSLPPGKEKELVLVCTYVVVVFSVFVQAPTIGPLTRRAMGRR